MERCCFILSQEYQRFCKVVLKLNILNTKRRWFVNEISCMFFFNNKVSENCMLAFYSRIKQQALKQQKLTVFADFTIKMGLIGALCDGTLLIDQLSTSSASQNVFTFTNNLAVLVAFLVNCPTLNLTYYFFLKKLLEIANLVWVIFDGHRAQSQFNSCTCNLTSACKNIQHNVSCLIALNSF